VTFTKLNAHHLVTRSLLLQIATCFRLFSIKHWSCWYRVKLYYIPVKTTEITVVALTHITLKPTFQGSIPGQGSFFSSYHIFVTHFKIFQLLMTLTPPSLDVLTQFKCDIKHSPSGYFTKFTVCPLQVIEDTGVGKKFRCIPFQNHSWELPEVVVVTSMGSNPALAQLFFILQTFCCIFFIAFFLLSSHYFFACWYGLTVGAYGSTLQVSCITKLYRSWATV